jgi:serine protease Do
MKHVTGTILIEFVLGASVALSQVAQPAQSAPAGALIADSALLEQYDRAMAEVTERAMRAVVEIDVSGYGKPEDSDDNNSNNNGNVITRQRSLGSGVIVDPSGYIMTNNHVVAGAERITVVLSPAINEMSLGRTSFRQPRLTYPGKLIGTSRQADLALIKIDATDLPTLPLSDQFTVHLGQTVLAIGAPEGLDHTVTKGIVSAVGRQPDPDQPMVYIQTDAPINHGNSGGPLVDRDGNLIGINTFIYSEGGGSEGLGFAIPQPIVKFVYEELRDHGHVRRSTIGANPQPITATLAAGLKLPQDWGVIISDVQPGSPADAAGLKRRDIVQGIDGRPIDSLPKYAALMYLHKRGEPVQMEILRGDKTMTLNITPEPVNTGVESLEDLVRPEDSLVAPLGIFVVPLSPEVRQLIGGARSESGVVVAGLLDNEPQIYADLGEGDIIRSINQKPVLKATDLRSAIAGLKPGDPAVLEIEREGTLRWVPFEME